MKKILLYGSTHCPTCTPVKEALTEDHIPFIYMDITSGMLPLKQYLKIRDHAESHKAVREKGAVGIPTLVIDGEPYLIESPEQAQALLKDLLS